jgi:hypothetical protein
MKNLFKEFEKYKNGLFRPGGGYITQQERQKAKKKRKKK